MMRLKRAVMDGRQYWNKVKQHLADTNKTQDWLAEEILVKPNLVRTWVSRGKWPDLNTAKMIATALSMTIDQFFIDDKPQVPNSQFSKRLSDLMSKKKMDTRDLADASAVPAWLIQHYLSSHDHPWAANNLARLAITLDASVDELLGIDKPESLRVQLLQKLILLIPECHFDTLEIELRSLSQKR